MTSAGFGIFRILCFVVSIPILAISVWQVIAERQSVHRHVKKGARPLIRRALIIISLLLVVQCVDPNAVFGLYTSFVVFNFEHGIKFFIWAAIIQQTHGLIETAFQTSLRPPPRYLGTWLVVNMTILTVCFIACVIYTGIKFNAMGHAIHEIISLVQILGVLIPLVYYLRKIANRPFVCFLAVLECPLTNLAHISPNVILFDQYIYSHNVHSVEMSSVKTKRGDGSAKMVKTMRRTTYLVILVAVCAFPPAVYFAAQRLSHPQDMWLFGAHPNKFNFLNDAGPLVLTVSIVICMVWWVWVPSSTSSPLSETFLQEVEVNRNFSAVVTPSSRNRSPTHSVQYSESSKSDMISERVRL